jgi:TrpR-related protein YerC/YecD
MPKFTNPSKLSKAEQESLLIRFCLALSKLSTAEEAAKFIKDLLSAQEAEMLAKRLKAAELIISGDTYAQICSQLKMAPNTIARVHDWLKISGDGFRLILKRMGEEKSDSRKRFEDNFDYFSWRNVKRRYPLYFWPQLLLENVVKMAKERDKQKLRAILKKMDTKSALFKKLNRLLD